MAGTAASLALPRAWAQFRVEISGVGATQIPVAVARFRDDDKAARIVALAAGAPVKPVRTTTLPALAKGLAACDAFVGADGGAMHVAAALGKPVVALFGDSDATLWRPWGVPQRVLQAASRDVADVSVEAVRAAFADLAREAGLGR